MENFRHKAWMPEKDVNQMTKGTRRSYIIVNLETCSHFSSWQGKALHQISYRLPWIGVSKSICNFFSNFFANIVGIYVMFKYYTQAPDIDNCFKKATKAIQSLTQPGKPCTKMEEQRSIQVQHKSAEVRSATSCVTLRAGGPAVDCHSFLLQVCPRKGTSPQHQVVGNNCFWDRSVDVFC